MKKVPCIICLNLVETNDKKVVATICKNCLTSESIQETCKNFDKEKLDAVLKMVKEQTSINKFGEIV